MTSDISSDLASLLSTAQNFHVTQESIFCYDDYDANLFGARWNPDKKKCNALNNSAKYTVLIEKYS